MLELLVSLVIQTPSFENMVVSAKLRNQGTRSLEATYIFGSDLTSTSSQFMS
jgi:hypothetical protein